jgi:hypothetical protein
LCFQSHLVSSVIVISLLAAPTDLYRAIADFRPPLTLE